MVTTSFISQDQCATIHRNALRVLDESGVKVEHTELAQLLTIVGGRITSTGNVAFEPNGVEQQIQDAQKDAIDVQRASAHAHVGIYECQLLDPQFGVARFFNETTLAQYIGFARSFDEIGTIGMLGLPFRPDSIAGNPQPLVEKLYAWKYGIQPHGAVHDTRYCDPLLEMFRCHASAIGVPIEEVFAASGYLVSPLTLARPQCEQLLWFADRGLRMSIGTMPSIGGSAPVSLAGSITLMLAEQIFLFLLRKAVFGEAHFDLGVSVCSLDMRNGFPCYGRPEQYRAALSMADMARFYGCQCHGHAGLTDAHVPSAEAGAQKMMGLITAALSLGSISVSAGLLSMDEICSPVQLVIDVDIANALNALLAEPAINDTECAVDEILEVGQGGNHMGSMFTADRCRSAVCSPRTWTAGPAGNWNESVPHADTDAAREIWMQHIRTFEVESSISPDEEAALREIIEHR